MIVSVYMIVNKINNKMYIGKTCNPHKRWSAHRWQWTHQKYPHFPLYKAMKKYGISNFEFEILEQFSTEINAFEAEICWISYLKSCGIILYNCTNGGEGVSGLQHSYESKIKMSKSQTKSQRKRRSREHFNFEKQTL
jgi:group I intron endonuclease